MIIKFEKFELIFRFKQTRLYRNPGSCNKWNYYYYNKNEKDMT